MKKKRFSPHKDNQQKDAERHDGQRISVRPGNFNPPPQKDASAPVNVAPAPTQGGRGEQANAQQEPRQGNSRNRRNRRNRHKNDRANKQPIEQRNATPVQEKPDNGTKNNRNDRAPQQSAARAAITAAPA